MASSLLGMVNQLQHMETTFLKVLVEAAMKLASLTDASLFLLVETQDGRRFAGKRSLCDAYLDGHLQPSPTDREFSVDVGVSGLRECEPGPTGTVHLPANGGSPGPPKQDLHFETYNASVVSQPSRKRSGDSNGGSAWKQRRLTPPTSSKAQKRKGLQQQQDEDHSSPNKTSYCRELLQNDFPFISGDFTEDVDVKVTAVESGASVKHLHADVENVAPEEDSTHNVSLDLVSAAPPVSSLAGAVDKWGGPQDIVEDPFIPAGSNFTLKCEALKGICGPKFEQAHSEEFKLLNSCMYEFGRIVADKYMHRLREQPDFPHRPFFQQEFEGWVLQFENIQPYGHIMIMKDNKKYRTLLAHMRKTAGDSFNICIKKKMNRQIRESFGWGQAEAGIEALPDGLPTPDGFPHHHDPQPEQIA